MANDAKGTLSGDLEEAPASDAKKDTLSGDLDEPAAGGGASGTLSGDIEPGPPVEGDGDGAPSAPDIAVDRELGRGGMGIIWLARQESLARPVAVKTLKSELCSGPAAAKFEAEALVTGRLEHPNIPPVHVYGRDAAGRPYLCMKLVKGLEWGKLLEPEKPEHRERAAAFDLRAHLGILRRVCEAVAYAHSQGVIHRDLKPENVMVGEFGEVLVMDWGIALDKNAPPEPAEGGGPRRAVGTPAYIAPEMAECRVEAIGPATDVYLLGGILYEILTGQPPHEGEGIFDVLLNAKAGIIRPPAERAPGRAIPEELAEIAMRALECDPAKRYATPMELSDALLEFHKHEASRALTEFGLAELDKSAAAIAARAEKPSEVYARLAGAVAALAQASESWTGNRAARQGLARARVTYASYAVENGDLALAEAELERAGPDAPGAAEARAKLAAVIAERAADARRRRRQRTILIGVGMLAAVAVGLSVRQSRRADASEAARRLRERAVAETVGAKWADAEDRAAAAESRAAAYERGVAIDPSWYEGLCERARAYVEVAAYTRDPAKSAAMLELAGAIFDRALAMRTDDPQTLSDRAYIAMNQGEWAKARELYGRSLAFDRHGKVGLRAAAMIALDDGRPSAVIDALSKLKRSEMTADDFYVRSIARYVAGDLDAALADAKKAESYQPTDEWYIALVALVRLGRGELTEAGADLQRGLRADPPGPHLLPLLAYRAALLGDRERAERMLDEARRTQKEYARSYLALAPFFTAAARAEGARGAAARAIRLEVDIASLVPAKPAMSIVLRRRGEELLAKGDIDGALAASTRALADDPADGAARLIRGSAFAALGQPTAARHELELVEMLAPERAGDARARLAKLEGK